MARLDSKVALITGGESGIGLATARLFVAEGARVHLAGLVRSRLADAVAELGPDVADFSVTDVTVEEQVSSAVEQAVSRFGALDVLFSNAGISGDIAPIAEYPADVFRRVLDVHVLGAFFVLKHGLPVLRDGRPDLHRVGDICDGPGGGGAERGRARPQLAGGQAEQADPGALGHKGPGRRHADAALTAGDDRSLALQTP